MNINDILKTYPSEAIKPKVIALRTTGVTYNDRDRRWESRICVNKNQIRLGRFDDFFEGVCQRKVAELKYWG